MRSRSARQTVAICMVIVSVSAIQVTPCLAQTPVASLDELRRELAAGDAITVVPAVGSSVAGKLIRFGSVDLALQRIGRDLPRGDAPEVTVPLDAIRSVERRRDPARNGAAIGAAIGAAYGGTMVVRAMVVDRNEMGEWAPLYAGGTLVCTAIGALVGWAVDAARSKPHIKFDAPSSEGRKALPGR